MRNCMFVVVIAVVALFLAPAFVGAQTLDKNSVRLPNGDIVFPATKDTLKFHPFHPFQPLTKEDSLKKRLEAQDKKLKAQGKLIKSQGERIANLEKRADLTDTTFKVVQATVNDNSRIINSEFAKVNFRIDTTARASIARDSYLNAKFVLSEIEWANKVASNEAHRDSVDSILLADINIVDFEGKKLRPGVLKAKRARCAAEKRLQSYKDSVNANPPAQSSSPSKKRGCNCKGTSSSSDIFSIPTFDSPIDKGWELHLLRKFYFQALREQNGNGNNRSTTYISLHHKNSDMT